jgi:predicted phage baseplate assembly protein
LKARISTGSIRPPEHIEFFPMRGTIALVASERIDLAEVPLGHSPLAATASVRAPVEGTWIELDGLYPDLRRGRTLLVTGTLVDADGQPLGPGSETVVVAVIDGEERTTIRFATAMAGRYERSSVVIYGNVASASHGESVRGEILGDGDASAEFQSFAPKKNPITFVPAPGAPGGVTSTLRVSVDGVRWTEVDELYGQPPDARVYVSRRDAAQATRVLGGDGRHGARLSSGRGNVTADYRVGLGPDGNVDAGSLRTLLKKPLGLKRVANPAAAAGGAEAEDPTAVKKNAPGTVRTFGRVVSIRDFEDAAREYVGVAKARASFVWDGEGRIVNLVVAGDDGATIDIAGSGLLADLDVRRDPHQPLVVRNFQRRPVVVRLSVAVDDRYVALTVRRAADAALRGLLAFDALELGEAVHLSDIHRAIQHVEGVVAVDVDEFRFTTQPVGTLEPRLLVAPHELVWVADPDDLEVTDAGGPAGPVT